MGTKISVLWDVTANIWLMCSVTSFLQVVTANVWLICSNISVLWNERAHIWFIGVSISRKVFGIEMQDCNLSIGALF